MSAALFHIRMWWISILMILAIHAIPEDERFRRILRIVINMCEEMEEIL